MRCRSTDRLLAEVRAARPGVEIEKVEILEHPRRVLRERVMTIPLIEINGRRWVHPPSVAEICAAVDEG
jgi:hypothetical protein